MGWRRSDRPVDDVYGATYERLREHNRRYFERYPDDRARVREIHRRIEDEDVRLPSGDRLSVRRFRQMGMWLGDSAGFELLHHVLELPFGSPAFLQDVESAVRWTRNPLYATLHESSYADGGPTRWSADRLTAGLVRGRRAVHGGARLPLDVGGVRRRCDAIGPRRSCWPSTRGRACTTRPSWPTTRCRSRPRSTWTTSTWSASSRRRPPRSVRGLRPWITNEYAHNGIRADGERVLDRLIALAHGRA